MRYIQILAMGGWKVLTCEEENSYLIKYPCGKETLFQGEDAMKFREVLEQWLDNYPHMYYSTILQKIMSGYTITEGN